MTDEQATTRRGNIIRYVVRWKNHPMCKGMDMYWDGALGVDGEPASTGANSISGAHMFATVQDAINIIAKLSTPEGNLPADVVGVRRTVSWTII